MFVVEIECATYTQSTRDSFSMIDPSGVRTRRKMATSTKEIPARGRFRSVRCNAVEFKALRAPNDCHSQNNQRLVASCASEPA